MTEAKEERCPKCGGELLTFGRVLEGVFAVRTSCSGCGHVVTNAPATEQESPPAEMTLEQLKVVHAAVDLLFAQYILAHPGKLMRHLTVFELGEWNAKRIAAAMQKAGLTEAEAS